MWLLLDSKIRRVIESAEAKGAATAEQIERFRSAQSASVSTTRGTTALITISGVLSKRQSIYAMLCGEGCASYPQIADAIAAADANAAITDIELCIDSPGGAVDGLFDLIAVMQSVKKPMRAVVRRALSAAYAIASQADEIIAQGPAASFGSIGVAVCISVWDDEIDIASTKAPKKRPDLRTPEGVAIVREELDALHDLFVDAIATGRGVTVDEVNTNFGEGGELLAAAALKRGMIDAIQTPNQTTTTTKPEARSMDLQTLSQQHPAVYAAAVAVGRDEERDRVAAHLTMGTACGDMTIAIDAINAGASMTAALQAKYLAAGMNRADIRDRQSDDAAASLSAPPAANTPDRDKVASDNILLRVAESMGIEVTHG